MSLKEKINADLKEAMKQRDQQTVDTLRLLMSQITVKEKEKRAALMKETPDMLEIEVLEKSKLNDEEALQAVIFEAKKRDEAALAFAGGGRPELAEKEKAERAVLQKYLPLPLSDDELEVLVRNAVSAVQPSGPKDMGKVMAVLSPQVKGRVDGQKVAQAVKKHLAG